MRKKTYESFLPRSFPSRSLWGMTDSIVLHEYSKVTLVIDTLHDILDSRSGIPICPSGRDRCSIIQSGGLHEEGVSLKVILHPKVYFVGALFEGLKTKKDIYGMIIGGQCKSLKGW